MLDALPETPDLVKVIAQFVAGREHVSGSEIGSHVRALYPSVDLKSLHRVPRRPSLLT